MNIRSKWDAFTFEEWKALASEWFQELQAAQSEQDSARRTVVLMNFTASAEAQWQFILAALTQARSDADLGHVAAGPLEHLLGKHGTSFIERVEQQATQDQKFARAMTGVRKHLMTDEVWARVEAIKRSVADPL